MRNEWDGLRKAHFGRDKHVKIKIEWARDGAYSLIKKVIFMHG